MWINIPFRSLSSPKKYENLQIKYKFSTYRSSKCHWSFNLLWVTLQNFCCYFVDIFFVVYAKYLCLWNDIVWISINHSDKFFWSETPWLFTCVFGGESWHRMAIHAPHPQQNFPDSKKCLMDLFTSFIWKSWTYP